jgi:hypothetical protein
MTMMLSKLSNGLLITKNMTGKEFKNISRRL